MTKDLRYSRINQILYVVKMGSNNSRRIHENITTVKVIQKKSHLIP